MPRLLFRLAPLSLAAVLTACGGSQATEPVAGQDESAKGQPVETARVVEGALTAHYAATAALEAEQAAQIVAEVPGTVLEILVEEGDHVRAGQVLACLDAAHSTLQLREAQADLDRRRNDVSRSEKLLERKLIAATRFDETRSEFAVRKAEVALARMQVNKAEIRAPFDGIVTRRWIKRGQLLATHAPVFDMADFNTLRAELFVPERDAVTLAADQPVSFNVDALGQRRFEARVERVAPTVDAASGTVKVTVRIDNRDRLLRPGLFARMDIAFMHLDKTVLMPKLAVLGSREAPTAWVVEDGRAVRTPIRVGYEHGNQVQVIEGLAVGSEVVVMGHETLTDGAAVEVIHAAPMQAVASALPALPGG